MKIYVLSNLSAASVANTLWQRKSDKIDICIKIRPVDFLESTAGTGAVIIGNK